MRSILDFYNDILLLGRPRTLACAVGHHKFLFSSLGTCNLATILVLVLLFNFAGAIHLILDFVFEGTNLKSE